MIEAHELTKRYGDTTAVHSLSFTIAPGTVTGFLGPNGAGKSTTADDHGTGPADVGHRHRQRLTQRQDREAAIPARGSGGGGAHPLGFRTVPVCRCC
jgi:ABC-type hemin transport system ATPase subunit